ncbi:alpha/beta hydrolase-fold protein [Planctomicrobium sp. SH661]|uniref:carboxylesterase family protein n=1 Tax=Planctomicrobium sp. SH661 TaxID=3448124 RepID=UPI003F5B2505
MTKKQPAGRTTFFFLATIIMGSWAMPVCGEDNPDPFEKQTFTSASGRTLPYRLLRPAVVEPGVRYPVVLFLHGAGERGDDNQSQLVHVARELAKPDTRSRHPAFVIAPQCPVDHQWVDVPWSADSHTMPENPSVTLELVIELLNSLRDNESMDQDRFYATGLSMGGFGTWDLLQREPDRWAGAIAICGGGDPAFASKMKDVPVWAFHGDEDTVVKVHRSREMVDALKSAGGRPIYTEYPRVGHNSWTATAENRLVWDWLFSQTR